MGVDLGAVPVQTPALAGTRLRFELPRRHQELVQRSILGSPRPNSGCRPARSAGSGTPGGSGQAQGT